MLALLFSSTAQAWGEKGHEAIGMTAMSAITSRMALFQTKQLLGGKEIPDVANWAHTVADKENKWALDLHRQPVNDNEDCEKITLNEDCKDKLCLIPAIMHFYGAVNDTQTVDINFPEGKKFQDGEMLALIINLIGDLHQPFHVASEDRTLRMVQFQKKPVPLNDFWDEKIVQYVYDQSPSSWDGGWTQVDRKPSIKKKYNEEKKLWEDLGAEAPATLLRKWALESAKLACKLEKDLGPKNGDDPTPIRPTGDLVDKMRDQILIAGARTAIVVNSLLHLSIKHEIKKETVLKVPEAKEDSLGDDDFTNTHSRPKRVGSKWFQNLCINVVLLALVLVAFYFGIVKTTAPPKSTSQQTKNI